MYHPKQPSAYIYECIKKSRWHYYWNKLPNDEDDNNVCVYEMQRKLQANSIRTSQKDINTKKLKYKN
jgi:hypothetical protein